MERDLYSFRRHATTRYTKIEEIFTMEDFVFDYLRSLRKIVQKHAEEISHERPFSPAKTANNDICEKFFKLLESGELGFTFNRRLYTFRNRRGTINSALRTIHSYPPLLADIFNDPGEGEDFDFERKAFDDTNCFDTICRETNQQIILQPYEGLSTVPENGKKKFSHRIPDFLENKLPDALDKQGKKNTSETSAKEIKQLKESIPTIQTEGCCLVIARIITILNKPDDKLHDLFAIYSEGIPEDFKEKLDKNKQFYQCLWFTFTAFEDIEKQDRAVFLREALLVVNWHMNRFANRAKAPAENMKSLLDQLERACQNHPSMGCGTKPKDIKVRFVRMEFLDLDNKQYFPRQFLYPPVSAVKDLTSTVFFSHKKSKTVVKHLLWKWCKENKWKIKYKDKKITIHRAFQKIFPGAKNTAQEKQPDKFGEWIPESDLLDVPAGIYATRKKSDYWIKHNYSSDINTTAAFLIFNEETRQSEKIPYGILAFESKVQDAFSREDIKVFKSISTAVGTLLDISNFGNPFIDYSRRLRDAIVKYEFADFHNELPKFIYELKRLEIGLLKNFIERELHQEKIPSDIIDPREIETAFQCLFGDEFPLVSISRVGKWVRDNQDTLEKKWLGNNSESLLSFLESIPSSSNWHARLTSIPRALAGRSLDNPVFDRFPTGFSADAIYILQHEGEISQIVKFSSCKAIEKERKAYQDFVRYHIPLAARVPANGYAVETDGSGEESKKGFGVLVSDLVAGQTGASAQIIKSLADLCNDGFKNRKLLHMNKYLDALIHNFIDNFARWHNPKRKHLEKIHSFKIHIGHNHNMIKESARIIRKPDNDILPSYPTIQYTIKNGNGKEEKKLSSSQQESIHSLFKGLLPVATTSIKQNLPDDTVIHHLDSGENLEELFKKWEKNVNPTGDIGKDNIELISIIHGDLNPQNLTWAESHKKFQLIDFEHVRPGYRDSDQLKLLFSLLLNLHQRLLTEEVTSKPEEVMKNIAENIECGLNVIYSLAHNLKDISNTPEREDIAKMIFEIMAKKFNLSEKTSGEEKSAQSLPVARLFKTIIRTIFIEDTSDIDLTKTKIEESRCYSLKWLDHIAALKLAMQCFALKEITYAIKELDKEQDSTDFKRIKEWTDKINNQEEDKRTVSWLLSEVGKNDLYRINLNQDAIVSGLICSFLGYATVCIGLREAWD